MIQVGRYQIHEELGRGARGVVYRALDPETGRTVAIETIPLPAWTNADERQRVRMRLFSEAQAATVLTHPNIVAIYDVVEQEEFVCIVTEYVDGRPVDKMSQTGSIPDGTQLIDLLRQAAGALDYAHRKGIVHGDIKPANLIVAGVAGGTGRQAKIAGFGMAKFMPDEMPQDGTTVGPPNYLSPEQIQGTTVSGQSDQFSFGVVVYELLTGSKAFSADQLPALFYSICKQDPPPANQVNSGLSESAGKVLQRALMKDPNQRFASCGEFIGALSIALGEGTALADEAEAIREAPRPGPVISIPEEKPHALPTRVRQWRDTDELEVDERPRRSRVSKRLALILAMCFAIFAAMAFVVMSNSGPSVPLQVLDTKSGPITPPPETMEVTSGGRGSGGQATASRIPASAAQTRRPQAPVPSDDKAPIAPAPAPGPIGASEVELLTEPPGAKMIVDGRSDLICNSPCTLMLNAGRHTVSAELGGYNLGRRIFSVPSDASLFVNLSKSMGVVVVTSTLSGCTVLVDGRPSGNTPATLHLTTGSHRIAVVSRRSRHEESVEVQTDGFDVERFLCQ